MKKRGAAAWAAGCIDPLRRHFRKYSPGSLELQAALSSRFRGLKTAARFAEIACSLETPPANSKGSSRQDTSGDEVPRE
jgi:hypothetical protein